jgi:hypothetical protein
MGIPELCYSYSENEKGIEEVAYSFSEKGKGITSDYLPIIAANRE